MQTADDTAPPELNEGLDDFDEDELDDSLAEENEQRVRIFEVAAEWLTQRGHPSEGDQAAARLHETTASLLTRRHCRPTFRSRRTNANPCCRSRGLVDRAVSLPIARS